VTGFNRLVPLTTVHNFRDLGGYRTGDGGVVRCGVLYRSAGLQLPGEQDHPVLTSLGLRTIIDLRRPDEVLSRGRIPESFGLTYHNIDLCEDPWLSDHTISADEIAGDFADRYLEMAELGIRGANPVGRALALIADAGNAPLVFHCAAGKDRTGVLAALVLALLDVADADIVSDYTLSARVPNPGLAEWHRFAREEGVPMAGWVVNPAPAEAMELFLAGITRRYGSITAYAARCGFTRRGLATLRAHLVEPAAG
jgi:protein-tyrosine phosphatase